MNHIVRYSGGLCSYFAAKRVCEREGAENVTLLFADTKMEDPDLYRFLHESASQLGASLVTIADGRTPWEVFFTERYLGNSRVDPCSKILKRKLLDAWQRKNGSPEDSVLYFGIDWSEEHRLHRLRPRLAPWRCEAPMTERPFLTKQQMIEQCRDGGIEPPALYAAGFHHNNCGGFCVKSGQAQFANLLQKFPERYKFHEDQEEKIREFLGQDVSILKDRRGGTNKRLTLKNFRIRLEQDGLDYDKTEWGGCGCALE
jgi:hypothetical protein